MLIAKSYKNIQCLRDDSESYIDSATNVKGVVCSF